MTRSRFDCDVVVLIEGGKRSDEAVAVLRLDCSRFVIEAEVRKI